MKNIVLGGSLKKQTAAAALFCLFIALWGCGAPFREKEALYQVSTIESLAQGHYAGEISIKELQQYGDFGLGTFDALDGEMIVLDGVYYQIKSDGHAYPAEDSMTSPFAVVTFFTAHAVIPLNESMNCQELEKYVTETLPSLNLPFAVRIDGEFEYVRTRSVSAQKKPYPPLLEAVQGQSTFEYRTVEGAMAGFRLPQYMKGINVPGFHFHFLTKDHSAGGHVLDCLLKKGRIGIASKNVLFLKLPGWNLSSNPNRKDKGARPKEVTDKEIDIIEKGNR